MANAIDQLTDRVLVLGRLTIVRRAITAVAVTISAVLQTFLIQAFIQPADLLPSGLTGVAVLLDRVTSLGGVHIDISLGMLALNIPVALLCWSGISKRFVIFSMMQVVLSSLFLNIFHFAPFLGDKIMLIIFGGVVSGLSAAIALRLSPAHPPAAPTLSRCGFPTTRARPSGASSLALTALSWRSLVLCLDGTRRRIPSCSSLFRPRPSTVSIVATIA